MQACPDYQTHLAIIDHNPSESYFARVLQTLERVGLAVAPFATKVFDLTTFVEAQGIGPF